jgi:acetylornithine deacetylase/succinyl-diaminopimelate desuccinylase-like protein
MNYSSEVLIYLQKIKIFFKNDIKSREYFLVDTDEELFFKKVADVAQDNYEKKGDVLLLIEQFNSIRIDMLNIELDKKLEKLNVKIISNFDNIFIKHTGYEKICLN